MRTRRALPAIAAALALTASCGMAPSVPEKPAAERDTAVTEAAAPKMAMKSPAQLGINIYWHTTGDATRVRANAVRILNYMVSLNANSVALTFPLFTDGARPTRVYAGKDETPSPADLGIVIDEAKKRGLRVMLRPTIHEANLTPGWRGSLAPPNVGRWFVSYGRALKPYLELAQSKKSEEFVLGVELNSLSNAKSSWKALSKAAARVFSGRLSYGAHHDRWANGASDGLAPKIALDAYPGFQLPDSATVAQLAAAWRKWLTAQRPASVLSQTVIQEIGIAPQAGRYKESFKFVEKEPIVPAIQVKWFTASCQAIKNLGMPGMYFWAIDSNIDPAKPVNQGGSFIGRGDKAIKSCFAAGWKK